MKLDQNRRLVLLASLALGIYTIVIVPTYSVFLNQSICELSPATCIGGVKFLGGESPLVLLFSLIVSPLLVFRDGKTSILSLSVLSMIFVLVEWGAIGFPPIISTLSFARNPRCYLFGGNCLDHNLFHLSHVPFYLIMALFSYKAYRY